MLTNTRPIEQHLAQRRADLVLLRSQADELDGRVALGLRRLRRGQAARNVALGVETESMNARRNIEDRVAARQAEGEQLRSRIVAVQREIEQLESSRATADSDRRASEAREARIQAEVENLSQQVDYFEEVNDAIVRRAAENALRAR